MNSVGVDAPYRSLPMIPTRRAGIVGESAVMQRVVRLIERVAPTDASVFVTGESGSGKALAARAIHECSVRKDGPFIAVNCGAIPAGLIEAELFGSEKLGSAGAATQPGVFERAHGGTLFLDEVTEIPIEMQTRLLRVLESRRFFRVGAKTEYRSDVRVIAATYRCPLTAVEKGLLRQDLLYQLAVFPIEMPPLRNRGDDVEILADVMLAELNAHARTRKRFSGAARQMLKQHSWPGNVRELKNCIERAFILGDNVLDVAPLIQSDSAAPDGASAGAPGASAVARRLDIRVGARIHDMERSLIEATLDHFNGNKRRAADTLGCSLKTLYNKLHGYSHSQGCANS